MIILDASVLIGHLESADAHHDAATALLDAHMLDSFAASVITLAEVYTGAARVGRADQLAGALRRLSMESLELPADAAPRLGELRAATKLKMPDCCVLYAAESRGAPIATFDEALAARAADLGLTIIDGTADGGH